MLALIFGVCLCTQTGTLGCGYDRRDILFTHKLVLFGAIRGPGPSADGLGSVYGRATINKSKHYLSN